MTSIQYNFICDGPDCLTLFTTEAADITQTFQVARIQAADAGWGFDDDGKRLLDFCPKCFAARRRAKEKAVPA